MNTAKAVEYAALYNMPVETMERLLAIGAVR
jgi:hypothetical protein